MSIKIKTEQLKEMVSKAIKGASMNKLIPITSLIGIDMSGENLTLITTDGSNQLKITGKAEYEPMHGPQSYYTIVDADKFSKLVSKTTKEFIEFETQYNYLAIKGNGEYKLEIPVNEDGEIIRFPNHNLADINKIEVSVELLKNSLLAAKPATAKTMEIPFLTGYYLGLNTLTTDKQLVCRIDNNLMNTPILISSEMAELLQLLEGEKVTVIKLENELQFITNSIVIYGKELEGKSDFPVEPILNYTALDYKSCIKVDKQELLNVLDRMSLFVSDYDRNGVFLSFTPEGLYIRSQKSNAEELVEIKNTIETTFNCLVDIDMLKSQVQVVSNNLIELYFGQDKSIQIKDGNTTLVMSLLEKAN